MKLWVYISLALLVGGLVPLQGTINAGLSKHMHHPLQASFISFMGAVITLVALLFILRPEMPSLPQIKSVPLRYFTGGIYGVIFVTTILALTPRIGIANTVVATIVGQLIVSVIFDHFGLLGLSRQPATLSRILGCAGLIASLYFIQKT